MKSIRIAAIFALPLLLQASVKTEEKSQVHFEGMMGRMVGMFGGKAAKEGVISTVAVKGNRKMTVNDKTGQIIDLDEEKVYDLDMRGKSYKVTTFDEIRRRMREAEEKAQTQSREPSEPSTAGKQPSGGKEMDIDFNIKESGQKKNINGYDCREVVMTITVREKGKTLEESGGMVMTVNNWLGPRIDSTKEIAEFDLRYAAKMERPFFGPSAEQMAAAMAMYPMMKQALGKFQTENVNMDGTSILTVMTMDAATSPEQAAQQQQEKPQERESSSITDITSVRGVLGGFGRKMAKKRAEQQQQESGGPKSRATIMTTTHELVKVSTDVAAADVAIPAGFRQKQ